MTRKRTEEIEIAAREYVLRNGYRGIGVWDVVRHLLVAGYYRHEIPPDPISRIWNRIVSEPGDLVADVRAGATGGWVKVEKPARIYQLKITLREANPPIWRRILVAGDVTLDQLHWIIQMSMGWTDSHLHQFIIDRKYYSDPRFELDESRETVLDESEVTFGEAVPKEKSTFIYEYDFGDSWTHKITAEKIRPPNEDESSPRCIAGARACPPEDCGGVWGYEEFLAIMRNPKHPEYRETKGWAGGRFDPDRFDLEEINERMKRTRRADYWN